MHSLLVIILLSLLWSEGEALCTNRPQRYWALNTTEWPTTTSSLCGVSWRSIINIETSRMANPLNQYWVIAAHQYITANLNKLATPTNNTRVEATILWLGDSLERVCPALSTWQVTPIAYTMIESLRQYNNECGDETGTNNTVEALYYIYAADTLVIPQNETLEANKTLIYSLLMDEYRFRQFTVGGSALALTGIPILICIIVLIKNKRFRYHLRRKKTKYNPEIQIGGSRRTQHI